MKLLFPSLAVVLVVLLETTPSLAQPPAPASCAERSALLRVDLDEDGVEETVTANACSRQVDVDGTAVPFRIGDTAHQRERPGRFRLQAVPTRPSGKPGFRLTYSNNFDRDCVEWGSEDDHDYSRCFTNSMVFTSPNSRLQEVEACDEPASLTADLDGDGVQERAHIDGCTGILTVGAHSLSVTITDRPRYPRMGNPVTSRASGVRSPVSGAYSFDALEIESGRRELRVNLSFVDAASGEFWSQANVFRYSTNTLRRFALAPRFALGRTYTAIQDATPGGPHWVYAPGDGTVREGEDLSATCRRAARRAGRRLPVIQGLWSSQLSDSQHERTRQRLEATIRSFTGFTTPSLEVRFRLDQRTLRFERTGRFAVPGESPLDCGTVFRDEYDSTYAACPFVYTVMAGAEPEFRGEILRNLRSPDLEDWQPLDLTVTPGRIELLLTEEKPETTYLDAIALDVNGERLRPQSCLGETPPAYCEEDDVYFVLEEGEQLQLTFVRQQAAAGSAAPARLWANGHYVPH